MDNPPSSYSDGYQGKQQSQAQECETLYDYSHAAGFPQPDNPPSQGFYSAPTQADIQQPGYVDAQQPGYTNYGVTQQPGYAGDANGQQAGYAKTRLPFYTWAWRTWNSLWIVLTTLALLLLMAVGGFYYYLQTRSTPEKTLQEYCSAVKSDDGQALYDTYSSSAQAQVDEPHLQQGLRLIDFLSGGIQDCTVDKSSIQESDPQATARITFVLYNGRISSPTLHLVNENGQWKVENNPLLP